MSNKILWCAVGLLSVACAAQACYIHTQNKTEKANPGINDIFREQDKWIRKARKKMLGSAPVPFRQFDDLFNDDFFGRRFDPFEEMDFAEIESESKITANEVIVSLKIPGLKGESLNVDINDDRIRVAYDAKSVEEKKSSQGAYRSESVRRFEKIMPVPEEADPRKNRVVHEGNLIKIIFDRRQSEMNTT